MNRSRLLFIGFVAIALGAFVSFVVYKNLRAKSSGGNEPGVDVIVAANDIQVGAKVEDRDVRSVKVPTSVAPPNYFRSKSQIISRGVILPIQKGEFILPSKLAAENAGSGLPALIHQACVRSRSASMRSLQLPVLLFRERAWMCFLPAILRD